MLCRHQASTLLLLLVCPFWAVTSARTDGASSFELEVIDLRPYGVAFALPCARSASGAEFCNCEVTCDDKDSVYVQSRVLVHNASGVRRSSNGHSRWNNKYETSSRSKSSSSSSSSSTSTSTSTTTTTTTTTTTSNNWIGGGDASYAEYARCNPTADSTVDDYEYRCVGGGHGRLGRADVATSYATPGEACSGYDESPGLEPPHCRWKFEMSKKIGGFWYSTPATANACGNQTLPE